MLPLAGCGDSGLKLADATGTVMLDGEPMPYVGVVFHPQVGPIATGNTDAEGRFSMTTARQKGALVGEHIVTVAGGSGSGVAYSKGQGNTIGAPIKRRGQQVGRPRLSSRYASPTTSDLRVTVKAGEKNDFTFELEQEGAR